MKQSFKSHGIYLFPPSMLKTGPASPLPEGHPNPSWPQINFSLKHLRTQQVSIQQELLLPQCRVIPLWPLVLVTNSKMLCITYLLAHFQTKALLNAMHSPTFWLRFIFFCPSLAILFTLLFHLLPIPNNFHFYL